jgi:hypothetical protein
MKGSNIKTREEFEEVLKIRQESKMLNEENEVKFISYLDSLIETQDKKPEPSDYRG